MDLDDNNDVDVGALDRVLLRNRVMESAIWRWPEREFPPKR